MASLSSSYTCLLHLRKMRFCIDGYFKFVPQELVTATNCEKSLSTNALDVLNKTTLRIATPKYSNSFTWSQRNNHHSQILREYSPRSSFQLSAGGGSRRIPAVSDCSYGTYSLSSTDSYSSRTLAISFFNALRWVLSRYLVQLGMESQSHSFAACSFAFNCWH